MKIALSFIILIVGFALLVKGADFFVDRPFIFAVTSDTHQPLFIGTVNNLQ